MNMIDDDAASKVLGITVYGIEAYADYMVLLSVFCLDHAEKKYLPISYTSNGFPYFHSPSGKRKEWDTLEY
jgi:ribosomal silencing factor RsfS